MQPPKECTCGENCRCEGKDCMCEYCVYASRSRTKMLRSLKALYLYGTAATLGWVIAATVTMICAIMFSSWFLLLVGPVTHQGAFLILNWEKTYKLRKDINKEWPRKG